jgi:hypothetical protein
MAAAPSTCGLWPHVSPAVSYSSRRQYRSCRQYRSRHCLPWEPAPAPGACCAWVGQLGGGWVGSSLARGRLGFKVHCVCVRAGGGWLWRWAATMGGCGQADRPPCPHSPPSLPPAPPPSAGSADPAAPSPRPTAPSVRPAAPPSPPPLATPPRAPPGPGPGLGSLGGLGGGSAGANAHGSTGSGSLSRLTVAVDLADSACFGPASDLSSRSATLNSGASGVGGIAGGMGGGGGGMGSGGPTSPQGLGSGRQLLPPMQRPSTAGARGGAMQVGDRLARSAPTVGHPGFQGFRV